MRKIYLHIGAYKCGSTAIQSLLKHNKNTLEERGFEYLDFNNKNFSAYAFNSNPLAWYFGFGYNSRIVRKNNEFKSIIESKLNKSNHSTNNVIISSEVFFKKYNKNNFSKNYNYSLDKYKLKIEEIKSKFKNKKLKIIIYVRRQDKYYESSYRQWVNHGYFSGNVYDIVNNNEANWYETIKCWSDVFGKENIIVRPLEKKQLVGGDLYKDFLNIIGIKFSNNFIKPNKKNCNISFNDKITKIFHLLNSNPAISKNKIDIFRNILLSKVNDKLTSSKKEYQFLSPKERIKIIKKHENSNKKIAKEFLNRKNEKLFYEQIPNAKESWVKQDKISMSEITELMVDMIIKNNNE